MYTAQLAEALGRMSRLTALRLRELRWPDVLVFYGNGTGVSQHEGTLTPHFPYMLHAVFLAFHCSQHHLQTVPLSRVLVYSYSMSVMSESTERLHSASANFRWQRRGGLA